MVEFEIDISKKEASDLLRQIADALENKSSERIRVDDHTITMVPDIRINVEYEEEDGESELEIELKWKTPERTKRAGKFELFKNERGSWYFRLKAANGQIILASEGYKTKQGAKNGIQSVKNHAYMDNIEMRSSKAGQPYFVIKASNSEVIGTSQMYKTQKACEKGARSVVNNAKGAGVVEVEG